MRISQFNELMSDEFGEQFAAVLMRDLKLSGFNDQTPNQAISSGEDPKDVWIAICQTQSVPKSRWHGVSKKPGSNK